MFSILVFNRIRVNLAWRLEVLLGNSDKALFRECQNYVKDVVEGKHPEISPLTESRLENLQIFVKLSTRILREGKLSEIRGARVHEVLVACEPIFDSAPNSTQILYKRLKKVLPKVVAEKVRRPKARRGFRTKIDRRTPPSSVSMMEAEPFGERMSGVPRESTSQRHRRQERSRKIIDDDNYQEGTEPHL